MYYDLDKYFLHIIINHEVFLSMTPEKKIEAFRVFSLIKNENRLMNLDVILSVIVKN
jgi:hypothetical protein